MKASPYERALDDLHFSEETKMRMAHNLEACMAEQTPVVSSVPSRNPRPRMSRRAVVGLALAATLAVGGGAAFATGALTNVVDAFSGLLGSGPGQADLITKLGVPLGTQATADGVTVTADAAIGDAHGYAVVFSIARADGEPLDLAGVTNDEGILHGLDFTESDVAVDGVDGATGGSWFFDVDPDDNVIQYMVRMDMATTEDGLSVAGRSATAHFGELVVRNESDPSKTAVVAKGPWDLAFEFDYEDSTVEVAVEPVAQEPHQDGRQMTVESLSVSPLGAYVTYTMDGTPLMDEESGKVSPEAEASWNEYAGIPICVTFADGSTQVFEDGNSPAHANTDSEDSTTVFRSCPFEKIVEVGDIASVTVGDATYEVKA